MGLALSCVLLIAVPGPSVLFIVGRALSYGRRTALASIGGNSTGSYLAAVLVALGLGPLLQQSDVLLHVIRVAGGAYLVWLGVRAFRHTGDLAGPDGAGLAHQSTWRAVRTGVVVGVSNPKTFIIFAAILPQFVDRSAGHVPAQMLVLALVPIGIGLVTDTVWGLAAGRARAWLSSSSRRSTGLARVGGLSMVGLGVAVLAVGNGD